MNIRLDKYLADMSVGTRSQVKQMVRAGKITLNGKIVKDSAVKIDTDSDLVCADGKQIAYLSYEYYMLNKPRGVVSAVSDSRERTVMELLADTVRKDLFPVGRLDKDTVGLLMITNHGELAHSLLSPKNHVEKVYEVWLDDVLSESMCIEIERGVMIEKDVMTRPAKLQVLENMPEKVHVLLTICEGRFHQVKKMFAAVGRNVTALKRIQFGPLLLDNKLAEGDYRPLSEEEVRALLKHLTKGEK